MDNTVKGEGGGVLFTLMWASTDSKNVFSVPRLLARIVVYSTEAYSVPPSSLPSTLLACSSFDTYTDNIVKGDGGAFYLYMSFYRQQTWY